MFCCAVKSPFGPQAYLMSVVSYNIMSPIECYGTRLSAITLISFISNAYQSKTV
jgi:hypothetical protein